ncbi:MAG TPA: class I SAM-dependent methyltransferase [Actinopolymorphaceae bacterium]
MRARAARATSPASTASNATRSARAILTDPGTRAAWRALLRSTLAGGEYGGRGERAERGEFGGGRRAQARRVADLGAGTGSLSVLLAELGHRVTGLELSPAMAERAVTKAADAGVEIDVVLGDAAEPSLPAGGFDVVLSRHVLWAMPDPAAALDRWIALLAPRGQLVLVEGFWHTGGGLRAETLLDLLRSRTATTRLVRLTDPVYWGGDPGDERYLIDARV